MSEYPNVMTRITFSGQASLHPKLLLKESSAQKYADVADYFKAHEADIKALPESVSLQFDGDDFHDELVVSMLNRDGERMQFTEERPFYDYSAVWAPLMQPRDIRQEHTREQFLNEVLQTVKAFARRVGAQ